MGGGRGRRENNVNGKGRKYEVEEDEGNRRRVKELGKREGKKKYIGRRPRCTTPATEGLRVVRQDRIGHGGESRVEMYGKWRGKEKEYEMKEQERETLGRKSRGGKEGEGNRNKTNR